MGLTRTRFIQANTALAKIQDPITVLNSESTVANIDVGFLINRDSGLSSNAAVYWSESGEEFVTALTANTGIPDSNIVVSSYANLRIGSLFGNIGGGNQQANVYITGSLVPSSNVEYDLGTSDHRFRSLWVSGNTIFIGKESISVDGQGTWSFSSGDMMINMGANVPFNSPNMTTGNLTVTSNLTVQGARFIANTTDVSFVDSAIELHTLPNLAPLTSDDGRDIGFKFHYYKTQDEHAFLGWSNNTGYLEWYDSGREGVGNVFTGNTYGTIKSGGLLLANTTVSTSATTGALQVAGGVGIAGNLYLNNVGDVSSNIGLIIAFVDVLDANVGSFQIYANANLATQSQNISNITSTANTNTAAYISTYTGNIAAGNVNASTAIYVPSIVTTGGNISGANVISANSFITTNGIYWAGNNAAFSSAPGGTSGQVQFNNSSTFDGAQLLYYSGSGNLVGTATTVSTSINTGGLVLKGGLGVNGNIFAGGLNGTLYGSLFIGTTDINYNRSSGSQTLTGVGIDGTAATATNAINTQITSNISSGTAYITFVNATTGNVEQNVNTSLTYNPNSGNLRAYGIQTDTGVYWAGNGAAFSSSPGGSSGQIQYNDNSSFAGANIVFNNSNGNLVVTSVTSSTSTTTGALVVSGGVGIGGALYTSGIIDATGNIVADSGVASTSTTTGALVVNGGVGVSGNLFASGNIVLGSSATSNVVIAATTATSSSTTGALVVAGGIGVSGNVNFGGNTVIAGKLRVNDDTDAVPYVMGSGAFHVVGGMSIGKDFWVGGNIYVANVISQTSTILQVSEPLVYLFPNSAVYNYDIGAFSEFSVGGVPKYTGVVRSVQTGEWVFFSNITNKPTSGSVGITDPEVIYEAVKAGNLIAANTTPSTSTTTGALIVNGGAGIAGNVYANVFYTTNGVYWAGNGASYSSGGGAYGNVEVAANLSTGFTGNIIPAANLTYNLGSPDAWWDTFYGISTQARYADLAEKYIADNIYSPGTVVSFGGKCEVTISTKSHDTAVAGVVSTDPAYLMNATQGNISVALTGKVPCFVRGPVNKGTVLTTSDHTGVAQALDNQLFAPGCVLGKSLEIIDDETIKLIEIAVGRF